MASQVVAQLQNFQTSQKILISDTNCSICPETKTVPLAHTTNVDHAIFNTQHPPFLLVLVHRQGVEDLSRIFSRLCISIIQPSPLSSCNIIHFILILDYLHYPPSARPDVIFFRHSQDSVFISTILYVQCTHYTTLLEHKICALVINRSCHFLFLVLVSPQTTRVLRVYNVFRTWVV